MIYYDPREEGKITECLRFVAGNNNAVSLDDLADSGDFMFTGNGPDGECLIGIERKRPQDLAHSVRQGRLADQLARMNRCYNFVYLIVEGIYRPDRTGRLLEFHGKNREDGLGGKFYPIKHGQDTYTFSEVNRALLSFSLFANTMVLRSTDEYDSARYMWDTYLYWQKNWDEHHAHEAIKSQGGVTLYRASVERRIAAELPGIGWKKSFDVERHFAQETQPLVAMMTASLTTWQELVGKKTGERVYKAIRGQK